MTLPAMGSHPAYLSVSLSADGRSIELHGPELLETVRALLDASLRGEGLAVNGLGPYHGRELVAIARELVGVAANYRPWILERFEPVRSDFGLWKCRECGGVVGPGDAELGLVDRLKQHAAGGIEAGGCM